MSKPSLIVTETLAQDEYEAYEAIELHQVVGTPIERAPKVIVDEEVTVEAQVAAAWAAVHARLSGSNSGAFALPGYDAVPEAAPEWSQVHASLDGGAPRPVLAEGSRASAPKPQAVIVPTPVPTARALEPGPVARPATAPARKAKTARRSMVAFTPEDEAFFAEGERLHEVEDFSDLDHPAPRRSRPMGVPSLRFTA